MSQREERRRYSRVQVQGVGAMISGLSVELVGVGPVELVDLGYGGAAFSQPEKARLSLTGEIINLDFFMNGTKGHTLTARVARLTDQMFAVEFIEATKDMKTFVDQLISNRMVGLNMNLVDPQFYRGKETFAYWFHGPKGTNLFLWEKDGALQKATMDFPDVALHWENDKFHIDNKMNRGNKLQGPALGEGLMRLAAEILSQMRSNVDLLDAFKKIVTEKVLSE